MCTKLFLERTTTRGENGTCYYVQCFLLCFLGPRFGSVVSCGTRQYRGDEVALPRGFLVLGLKSRSINPSVPLFTDDRCCHGRFSSGFVSRMV